MLDRNDTTRKDRETMGMLIIALPLLALLVGLCLYACPSGVLPQ